MTDAATTSLAQSLPPDASGGPVATPAKPPQTLDELMMAMDVVDTLRHQEKLVQAELTQGARDADLKARLRDLYESQGLTVTDSILEDGIRALKESRFSYSPPKTSWALWFARLWVRRSVLGVWGAGATAALGLTWGGYYLGFVAPQKAQVERTRIELSQVLPRELEDAYVEVVNLAQTDEGRRQAGALIAEGRFALGRKDVEGVRKAIAQIATLRALLLLEYSIRIVASNPSGVERIPDVNERARNYYLIVQAIAPDGRTVPVDITSEETGRTRRVELWGVRVSEDLYKAVRKDKLDDGIIQTNMVGQKQRGYLKPEFAMPVETGAITEW